MTLEAFWEMVNTQNGRCAICDIFKGNTLAVDHDHVTGRVRQLLCTSCNTGLGQFGDDPKTLLKAWHYLKRNEPKREAA